MRKLEGGPDHSQADKARLIKDRLRQHPNAKVRDIVASLELDGVRVTPAEVQAVQAETQNETG